MELLPAHLTVTVTVQSMEAIFRRIGSGRGGNGGKKARGTSQSRKRAKTYGHGISPYRCELPSPGDSAGKAYIMTRRAGLCKSRRLSPPAVSKRPFHPKTFAFRTRPDGLPSWAATFNTKCYRRLRIRKRTSRRSRIFCPAVQQMRSLVKICELRRSATGKKTFRKTGCGAVSVIAAWEQPIRLAPLSPRTSGGNSQKIRKSQVSAPEYPRQSIRGRADAKGKQARPRPEFRI